MTTNFEITNQQLASNCGQQICCNTNVQLPTKTQQFDALRTVGIKTVPFGIVKNVVNSLQPLQIVVYTDELKHHGDGKQLEYSEIAIDKYGDLLCSAYIHPISDLSKSRKILMIGEKSFTIDHYSDDWRTNCGTKEVIIQGENLDYHDVLYKQMLNLMHMYKSPTISVDFVHVFANMWLATDLNTIPNLSDINLSDYVSNAEIINNVNSMNKKFLDNDL